MPTKAELKQEAKELREKAETLEKRIAEMPEDEGPWKPRHMETYWYTNGAASPSNTNWTADYMDKARMTIANVFRTHEEAELHKLRLESMAKRWKPEKNGEYWYWQLTRSSAVNELNACEPFDHFAYAMGNMHPTREAAQAWYDKYGKAWEALLG